jgi:hypothetical protein
MQRLFQAVAVGVSTLNALQGEFEPAVFQPWVSESKPPTPDEAGSLSSSSRIVLVVLLQQQNFIFLRQEDLSQRVDFPEFGFPCRNDRRRPASLDPKSDGVFGTTATCSGTGG